MPIVYNHDHDSEINYFALTNFRNQQRKFGIKTDDRRRHTYVLGKTGMGKTTMLENLILNDIFAGHGVGVVDPHGDTAEKLLDFIPAHRVNDVIYFNPADSEYPIGFNVLESVNPLHKHLVAQGLMGVFKKIWPDVWSARMEHILNNCILALLDNPGSTLLGINRLLVDKNFRKRVVDNIKDPIVRAFWIDEYSVWEPRFRNEAIQPIQNKVGQFLSASIIRNIVAQVKSAIDMRTIMDSGKIIIMNLSKGRLGEDTSRLLGGMLITKMQLAAMERVDILEPDRRDFYLYVDEFQNFATESFANILSEARKYRLNLTIAHQYIGQLISDSSTKVRDAVFGNVGTIITFRIGAEDAEFMEKEFSPQFVIEDMVNLGKYDIYLRLMIDGMTSNPFSATTMPPINAFQGNKDKVIKISRERYAEPVASIEAKVTRWAQTGEADMGDLAPRAPARGQRAEEAPPRVSPTPSPELPREREATNNEVRFGARSNSTPTPPSPPPPPPPPKPRIEDSVPVPLSFAPEEKPLSLQDAMQKKPVLIKLGPQRNAPKPTQPPAPSRESRGGGGAGQPMPPRPREAQPLQQSSQQRPPSPPRQEQRQERKSESPRQQSSSPPAQSSRSQAGGSNGNEQRQGERQSQQPRSTPPAAQTQPRREPPPPPPRSRQEVPEGPIVSIPRRRPQNDNQ